MLNQPNQTVVGSVLFLDIVEYSKKSVMEQLRIKQRFNGLLTEVMAHIAPRDRIILDTGDGAAVSFLGNPEEALFVAAAMRNAISLSDPADHVAVRYGINLGPLRLVKDINGQLNIIGDGINVAQRVMSFSAPGQILSSRSYYEVVSCLSEDYAPLFSYEGSRTDKHVREHDVYAVGIPGPALRATLSEDRAGRSQGRTGSRRLLVAVPLVFAALVGAGVALRATLHGAPAAADAPDKLAALAPAAPATPPRAVPAPASKPAPAPLAPAVASATADHAQRPAAKTGPATVTLAVLPWGNVFVDGKSRGVSPPLKRLELEAGQHVVQIRNADFPSYEINVSAKSGEEIRIQHRFQ